MAANTIRNRAWMNTTTTGTGTITLTTARSGYFTFAEAGITNGQDVSYTIIDGADFEIGIGTYTSAGTTLTRASSGVFNTSKIGGTAGTSKINLSGTATVFIAARSEDLDYLPDRLLTTRGDIITRGSGSPQRLALGTSGFYLKSDGTDAVWAILPREVLTASRTYYVRNDGSDSNTGLVNSSGGAFLTIQKAINIALALDFSIFDVTIEIQGSSFPRTYTQALIVNNWVGSGSLTIKGGTGTNTDIVIDGNAGDAITCNGCSNLLLADFKMTTSSGSALVVRRNAVVTMARLNFGTITAWHMNLLSGGILGNNGATYTLSGNAAGHYFVASGAYLEIAGVTVSGGSQAFAAAFAVASQAATMNVTGMTFSGMGAATGTRYSADTNGVIITGSGASATYFPGNVAGSKINGGQYT